MLEGVLVILHVVVVVVRIGKEVIACGEHIARGEVRCRELRFLRFLDDEEILTVVGQALAELVAQVGVGVAVAYYLHGTVGTYAAMVGGEDDAIVGLGEGGEEFG